MPQHRQPPAPPAPGEVGEGPAALTSADGSPTSPRSTRRTSFFDRAYAGWSQACEDAWRRILDFTGRPATLA